MQDRGLSQLQEASVPHLLRLLSMLRRVFPLRYPWSTTLAMPRLMSTRTSTSLWSRAWPPSYSWGHNKMPRQMLPQFAMLHQNPFPVLKRGKARTSAECYSRKMCTQQSPRSKCMITSSLLLEQLSLTFQFMTQYGPLYEAVWKAARSTGESWWHGHQHYGVDRWHWIQPALAFHQGIEGRCHSSCGARQASQPAEERTQVFCLSGSKFVQQNQQADCVMMIRPGASSCTSQSCAITRPVARLADKCLPDLSNFIDHLGSISIHKMKSVFLNLL